MKFRNTLLLFVVLIFINFHCVTDAPVDPIKVTYTVEGFVYGYYLLLYVEKSGLELCVFVI
jgi:hypothetical protein